MAKILERDGLPTQQRRVLDYIEEYLEISGYPPSISEITDYLGVSSTFGVRKHLDALLRKGIFRARRRRAFAGANGHAAIYHAWRRAAFELDSPSLAA